MEENKNNAVEKVEKVAERKEEENAQQNLEQDLNFAIGMSMMNDASGGENLTGMGVSGPIVPPVVPELVPELTPEQAESFEQERANRRVELARIKEHRKAEKEKAKATRLREKNRRKAELKEKRTVQSHERKMQRQNNRQKNKERNGNQGGWLAAVISLGVATLVLASVLTFTFLMPSETDNMLEAGYQKSFYGTVENVDNMDLNLSKALVTEDSGALQKYLVDTAINSELAENEIQQLPLKDENKFYTTKLINQIGDYSKYLNNKLINGEKLSEEDYSNLRRLYSANLTLKNTLQEMISEMGDDFSMTSIMKGGNGNLVIHGFNELQNLSVEYPELIYDGPFSDGQNEREIKGLPKTEIDDNTAIDRFKSIFAEYSIEEVKAVGESGEDIKCINVQAISNGEVLFAQFSKLGGKLIMFSYAGSCESAVHSDDQAIESAQEFLKGLGIDNVKEVWINLSNNVYTINFAGVQDGVIIYGDLIKVRVCAETNQVIGIEAKSYYTNHTERMIEKAVLSESQAEAKVSKNITVETSRLALVPIGTKSERLCYEFSGEYDGSTYYVYIDAVSGRQVEMFKVIKSTEGTLLM